MSPKQKLQELLAKLKQWSESNGNEELDQHLAELQAQIESMADSASADDETGGNHPGGPSGKP